MAMQNNRTNCLYKKKKYDLIMTSIVLIAPIKGKGMISNTKKDKRGYPFVLF